MPLAIHHQGDLFCAGVMNQSSSNSSFADALDSSSQVNILRMKFRNIVFSAPGGTAVTNFSKDVSGIGCSHIQFPADVQN